MPLGALRSIVVTVSPLRPQDVVNHMGRAVQQFALRQVFEPHSKTLSATLHDSSGVKPYTVSSLFEQGKVVPVRRRLTADDAVWVRITTIGNDVSTALITWCATPPAMIEIDNYGWRVRSVAQDTSEHPWASQTEVDALIQRHHTTPVPQSVGLDFISPTTFHSESLHVPLPIPALVFRSIGERWNHLTGVPLSDLLPLFAQQFLEVAGASIDTRSVMFRDTPFIGFEGRVRYQINGTNEGLARRDPATFATLMNAHAEMARAVAMLTEFATYCGVGVKTTAGLGMARSIQS
jgi:CRISPR-associated endoribonuclease Cas6